MSIELFEHSRLVSGSGALWDAATRAEFLSVLGDGTLPRDAFHRWLVQDYLFANGLTTFQAIATAKTPRGPQKALVAGLSALDQEMDWFEAHAAKEGLSLDVSPHPVCRRYVDFLVASAYSQPFEVLLAILYGVEVSYLAAWCALEARGPFAEFIDRWSNEAFFEYVRGLLEATEHYRHAAQQELFNEVLRHEHDFWRMTWEG